MLKPYDALNIVLDNIKPLGAENVSLYGCLDRVVAAPVISARDIPGRDNSAMDGYAVNTSDLSVLPARLKVKGIIAAGDNTDGLLVEPGTAYKIMTGAHIPEGADAVVEWELTDQGTDYVTVNRLSNLGSNIRPAREDMAKGGMADYTGRRASPYILSRFASMGVFFADVYRKPRVAVISTGSEIAPLSDYHDKDKILDANSPALLGMLRQAGAEGSYLGVVRDDPAELLSVLDRARSFDMVVVTGGISTGDFDQMAKIAEPAGIEWFFHKVYQKPGKPVAFGNRDGVPVFALPGNPVSCMFCMYFYGMPAVRKMAGLTDPLNRYEFAVLGEEVRRKSGRIQFDRVRLEYRDGVYYAYPFRSQVSNLISSMVDSDAFMELDDFDGTLSQGEKVKVYVYNRWG